MFIFMSLCIIICAYVVFKILIAWHPDSGKLIKVFYHCKLHSLVSKYFSTDNGDRAKSSYNLKRRVYYRSFGSAA